LAVDFKACTQYPCAFSGKNGSKGAWILRKALIDQVENAAVKEKAARQLHRAARVLRKAV
jgi:hypothetical protein